MYARLMTLAILAGAMSQAYASDTNEDFDSRSLWANASELVASAPSMFTRQDRADLQAALQARSVDGVHELLDAKALIEIQINPEGRVSAHRLSPALPRPVCGSSADWLIRVANTGFVTAPLTVKEASRAPGPHPVGFSVVPAKLTGARIEYRIMRVNVDSPQRVDATLLFSVGRESEDLGMRSEISTLVGCEPKPAG